MTYKVEIEGIKWDATKKEKIENNLTSNYEFEVTREELVDLYGEFEELDIEDVIGDYIEDYLTEQSGFCHKGWSETRIFEVEEPTLNR